MIGKFNAAITGTGDTTLVAAPSAGGGHANPFIRITSLVLTASAVSVVTVKSGSTTIATVYMIAGGTVSIPFNPEGMLDCDPAEAFIVNPSAGNVGVFGTYVVKGA